MRRVGALRDAWTVEPNSRPPGRAPARVPAGKEARCRRRAHDPATRSAVTGRAHTRTCRRFRPSAGSPGGRIRAGRGLGRAARSRHPPQPRRWTPCVRRTTPIWSVIFILSNGLARRFSSHHPDRTGRRADPTSREAASTGSVGGVRDKATTLPDRAERSPGCRAPAPRAARLRARRIRGGSVHGPTVACRRCRSASGSADGASGARAAAQDVRPPLPHGREAAGSPGLPPGSRRNRPADRQPVVAGRRLRTGPGARPSARRVRRAPRICSAVAMSTPTPTPAPVVDPGELFRVPHAVYGRLREEGPVHRPRPAGPWAGRHRASGAGTRHPLLPRRPAGPDGDGHRAHRALRPLPRPRARRPPARSAPAPVRSRGLLALPVRSILPFGMHYVADATKALTSSTEGAYCPTGTPRP